MADAYVYEQDCDDFTTLGMCGRLRETKCEFEEVANGMSELTLEHPIDSEKRFALLIPGRIIKAVVPVRSVPEVGDDQQLVTTLQRWKISSSATREERTVYNKRDDQIEAEKAAAEAGGADSKDSSEIKKKKLKTLKRGTQVTVTRDYGDSIPEFRVRTGKIVGYLVKTGLTERIIETYSGSGSFDDVSAWYEDESPSWTAKEQLFRIYSIQRSDDRVVVQARHIFYDNAHTITRYDASGAQTLPTMLSEMKRLKIGHCSTDFYTNIGGSRVGAHYENRNLIEVLLDPEDGLAARWGADVIRDNDDCYLIANAGYDRGVALEYGKDLAGVTYDVNWENIATNIRPVGEKKNGDPLYLVGNAGVVKSPRRADYPFAHVQVLQVSEAKVSDDMTTAEARAKLQAAANELIAQGCDQPEVGVTVAFQLLGETKEYEAYKNLKNLYLFDKVRVLNKRLGIDVDAKVNRVVWDCKTERMREVELGTLTDVSPKVSNYQISSVNGGKLSSGSVTGHAIASGSVDASKMDPTSFDGYLEEYLPTYLSTYLSTYLPLYLPTYLTTFLQGILANIQAGQYDADAATRAMYDIVISSLPPAGE